MTINAGAWSVARGCLLCLAVLLVGGGAVRVHQEIGAGASVENLLDGFRNANGFGAQADITSLRGAMLSGDRVRIVEQVSAQIKDAPFDPVLMALDARIGAKDLRTMAVQLDRAYQIAPRNQMVRALRNGALHQLENSPPRQARWAK